MTFPADHPEYPNQPKGMKQVLQERDLWIDNLLMKCRDKCPVGSNSCCAKRLLERQPDFQEQCSLVQEVIEAAGHLCIFLPKFHCELNFIEYFWGAVKKYLRDHCDYTFTTLQENLPKALESVAVETIRKWEHRMWRWLEAYDDGLAAHEAQLHVQKFSSRKYKSHRRVPEGLGVQLDH
jgi:transposase